MPQRLNAALDFPMTSVADLVENSGLLVNIFGYWPSFHDAEVLEMNLDRGVDGVDQSLTARIHLFEMTRVVASDGRLLFRNHVVARFLFRGVVDLVLNGFNHQNVIEGLLIEVSDDGGKIPESIVVDFDGCYGVECSFRCKAVSLLSVDAEIPSGSIYERGGKI